MYIKQYRITDIFAPDKHPLPDTTNCNKCFFRNATLNRNSVIINEILKFSGTIKLTKPQQELLLEQPELKAELKAWLKLF